MTCLLRADGTVKNDFNKYYERHRGKYANLETLGELAYILTEPEEMIMFHLNIVINNPTDDNFRKLCNVNVPSIADKYDIVDLYFALACLVRGYCDSFISYFYPKIDLDKFGIVCTKKVFIQNIGVFNIKREDVYVYTICPCIGRKN